MGMLSPCRVIDLTDSRAALGPLMLANLGAEVIRVEPPGFAPAEEDAFQYAVSNRGKRRIALDLDAPGDRERFFELVRTADFLFENAPPGAMAARGLPPRRPQRARPRTWKASSWCAGGARASFP